MSEELVTFRYGGIEIEVTAFDALMLGSDLFLLGDAYVVPDGDHYRRVRPDEIDSAPDGTRRIEKMVVP